jgi:amino acid permease
LVSTNRIFVHAYYVAYKFYNKEREIIQAAQNDTDGACMVQEESCMTKEEILSGFDKS